MFFLFFIIFHFFSDYFFERNAVQKEDDRTVLYLRSFYNSNVDVLTLDYILDKFYPDTVFLDRFDKTKWIDKANAMYQGYKNNFTKIELFYNRLRYDLIFYLNNGKKYYFFNGLMLPEESVDDYKLYHSYFYKYEREDTVNVFNFPTMYSKYISFKFINYDFYYSIYGKKKKEIQLNLEFTKYRKFKLYLNKMNLCHFKIKKIFNEFEELAKKNTNLKRWSNDINSISAFAYRNVEYQDRPSLHSFGIAVDIITKDKRDVYWYWSSKFKYKWWEIPLEKRTYVPDDVVKLFEKHGFCWGGKWIRFDNMHFEYKPEIFYRKFD